MNQQSKYIIPGIGEFNNKETVFTTIKEIASNVKRPITLVEMETSVERYFQLKKYFDKYIKRTINEIAKIQNNPKSIKIKRNTLRNFLVLKNCYLGVISKYPELEFNEAEYIALKSEHSILTDLSISILSKHSCLKFADVIIPQTEEYQKISQEIYELRMIESHTDSDIRRINSQAKLIRLDEKLRYERLKTKLEPIHCMKIALNSDNRRLSFSVLKGVLEYDMDEQRTSLEVEKAGLKQSNKKSVQVWTWRQANKDGNITKCSSELKINRDTVSKYWNTNIL